MPSASPLTRVAAASILAASLASCASIASVTGGGTDDPPNVIVLVTDDHRWDALGVAGNPYMHTPNLDRLAAEGAYFPNAFVTTSICVASRASILTGQYARTHGVHFFHQSFTPEQNAATYSSQLGASGYYTGFVGKYGLGGEMPVEYFDSWAGFPGQGTYFKADNPEAGHLTGRLGDQTLAFLDSVPEGRPFCLSVSYKAAHAIDYDPDPFQYDPSLAHLYADVTIPMPELATEAEYDALPPFLHDTEGRKRWQNRFPNPDRAQESVKNYYRLLSGVDREVGRILDALEASGELDNTIIVFTGDNGFYLGDRGLAGKWYMYEESIRVPLIVYDGRRVGEIGGVRPGGMALSIDIAPTVLDLAGLESTAPMDGRSLAPLMRGEDVDWRTEWLYEHLLEHPHIPKSEGVRGERWKYVRWIDQDPVYEQLFDLEADPLERENLALNPAHRETLEDWRGRWMAWRAALGDPVE